MKQNRAILSLKQVAVCVEGSAAEGALDQFKADVLFLLAGPQMGIKKKKRTSSFHFDPPTVQPHGPNY